MSGKGADSRSSSRASGSMTYRLSEGAAPDATRVEVVSDINLAGSLAQFGKGAIMQEVANRITAEFVKNFERSMSRLHPARLPRLPTSSPAQPQARSMPETCFGRFCATASWRFFANGPAEVIQDNLLF